ncbi:glucoamylase family protein [Paenibacillus sp. GCM10027626]|uniref:glucoamylase family protein n=1 Tax=Paenibacillus sp. GCM10027626 TaxID=3273411 RepID=UPI0036414F00
MKTGGLKRQLLAVLAVLAAAALSGCFGETRRHQEQAQGLPAAEALLDRESRLSFDFFWQEANTDEGSDGYGLIRDRAPGNPHVSSIASVGFGLTALAIGAERKWVGRKEAEERAIGTLSTLLERAEHVNGFFYHFLQMDTARRTGNSEVSIIDTAIALNGAITAGEYFGGETKQIAEQLYRRVNWEWYRDPQQNMFYMGYSPEEGFQGHWDFYAEQLMLYFLAAGSPTFPADPDMLYSFVRHTGSYGGGEPFIHAWFGSIFTYQFSHAWFGLQGKSDKEGVDWWENSIRASRASRQFAIDQSGVYNTFGPAAWGLTASDAPHGYEGLYGAPPSGYSNDAHRVDGTLAPAGALGSIVFTPEESLAALEHYYNISELVGEYGLKDAYNTARSPAWFAADVIGIDKGITLLMAENYRTGFVWEWFMKNKYVQHGMKAAGVTEK